MKNSCRHVCYPRRLFLDEIPTCESDSPVYGRACFRHQNSCSDRFRKLPISFSNLKMIRVKMKHVDKASFWRFKTLLIARDLRREETWDLPLDELLEALADATELRIEVDRAWTDGRMFEWLGRALSSREYLNLRKCHLYGRSDPKLHEGFLLVLQSIASGHLPNLEDLDLFFSVGVEGVGLIVEAAEAGHLSKLETLISVNFDDGCCEALGNAALRGHFRPLQSLRLVGDRSGEVRLLSDGGVQYLARAMEAGCLQKLRTLEITPSGMGDQGAEWLAGALKSGHVRALERLDVGVHGIQAKGFGALASALEEGFVPSLKCLRLDPKHGQMGATGPCVEKDGGEAIARALQSRHLSQLEELDLCRVGGSAMVVSALATHSCPDLKILLLSYTGLGEEGAVALAKAWESHRFPRLERLELSDLGEEAWRALTAALASQSNSKLRVLWLGKPPRDEAVVGLATALEKSQSHLRKLAWVYLSGEAPIGEVGAAALVNAYRNNPYLTATLGVIWPEGKPWQDNWSGFRDRNERRAADLEALRAERQVDATHGRVFLCGAPKVGKTTLRKSLSRASSPFPACCWASPSVQERTRGIEVVQIGNGKLSLVLWDLAGQNEYHLLHGAFFPDLAYTDDANATLFVVVCRANAGTTDGLSDRDDLRYWLRFIASSSVKGLEGVKRKVLVVLNLFKGVDCNRRESWNLWLANFQRDFSEYLDIQIAPSVFDVRSRRGAKRFERLLFTISRELLQGKKIHQVFSEVQEDLRQWSRANSAFPIYNWKDGDGQLCGRRLFDATTIAALRHLSEAGIVINFPKGPLRDGGVADTNITVVNPEWFCREVVGHLLLPEIMWDEGNEILLRERLDAAHCMTIEAFRSFYEKLTEPQVETTVAMLLRLGLCFQVGTDRLFIPALVPEEIHLPLWWTDREPKPGQWTVGFSLVPEDADKTLMPSSLFARLQVELAQDTEIRGRVGNEFCAGKKFVAFKALGVKVLVEYRADDHDSKSDRVDIMVKPLSYEDPDSTDERRREVRTSQVNFAGIIFNKLDRIRRSSCPGVRFQRRVMQPWSTADVHPSMANRDVSIEVEDMKMQLRSLKPGDEFTLWEVEGLTVAKTDLLSAEDLMDISQHLFAISEKAQAECDFMEKMGLTLGILAKVPTEPVAKFSQVRSMPPMRRVDREMSRGGWMEVTLEALLDRMEGLENEVRRLNGELKDLKNEVGKVKNQLRKLQVRRSELINKFTGMEKYVREGMENTVPRYAYLAESEDQRKWITLNDAVKKPCTLHLLCEAQFDDQRLHEVQGQNGLVISQLRNWVEKCLPWLKTSITLLCAITAVGGAALPGLGALAPAVVGTALQLVDKAVQEVQQASKIITDIQDTSVPGSSSPAAGSSSPSVKSEPVTGLAKKALEDLLGSLTSRRFRDDFKLRRVRFLTPTATGLDGRQCVVWICDECHQKYDRENKVEVV